MGPENKNPKAGSILPLTPEGNRMSVQGNYDKPAIKPNAALADWNNFLIRLWQKETEVEYSKTRPNDTYLRLPMMDWSAQLEKHLGVDYKR